MSETENVTTVRKSNFETMTEEARKEAARKGGKAAHAKGTAYKFDSEKAHAAALKGVEKRKARAAEQQAKVNAERAAAASNEP